MPFNGIMDDGADKKKLIVGNKIEAWRSSGNFNPSSTKGSRRVDNLKSSK